MIEETNFRVIANYGWFDLIGGAMRTRTKDYGVRELGTAPQPRVHVHDDGITITGLPREAIEWLKNSLVYDRTHDEFGTETGPRDNTMMVTISPGS